MDETINIQSVPENALPDEPEYIIKKKFNFAAVPALFLAFIYGFLAIGSIILLVEYHSNASMRFSENYLRDTILSFVFISFATVAWLVLCVFSFARIKKFILGIPMILAASYWVSVLFFDVEGLIKNIAANKEAELEGAIATSSGYPNVLYVMDILFDACLIFSILLAAVYVIVAAVKKSEGAIKKLWFTPAVVYLIGIYLYIAFVTTRYFIYERVSGAQYASFGDFFLNYLLIYLLEAVIFIPEFIAILSLCKWISDPCKKVLK